MDNETRGLVNQTINCKQMINSEIVIYVLALAGVLGAVIAFLKTPKEQRFSYKLTRLTKADGFDYAPEYTKKERVKLVIIMLAFAVPFYIGAKYWFFPWLKEYASHAYCYQYGSYTGTHVLFYGLFIGMPLLIAIVLFSFEGISQIKVFRLGQYPLPNQKVLSPTKYIWN